MPACPRTGCLRHCPNRLAIWGLLLCWAVGTPAAFAVELPTAQPADFNRDIRPLLSENCYHCHGFDAEQRQAGLRLDEPGWDTQAVLDRITSDDPDLVMPPIDSHRELTEPQRQLLVQWVQAGAEYDRHWAFTPVPTMSPPLADADTQSALPHWSARPLDRFVLRTLQAGGMQPMPRTTAEKWLRRVSLDLTGIAPTPAQIDAFHQQVQQHGDHAYETAVDQLMRSSRYGERMAQDWLDLARYADTHGFNNDSQRSMWRWRDWVIQSYNNNLPYDQFLTKQIAGDLLPDATLDDHIATGFCRNHVINSEGGIIDEEYRVEYVVDRIRTLGTGILGLTLECARCHDHKFDPISQQDFFSLYAFFNQVDEVGEDGRDQNAFPLMLAPTAEQQLQLQEIESRITAVAALLAEIESQQTHANAELLATVLPAGSRLTAAESSPAAVSAALLLNGEIRLEPSPLGTAYQLQNAQSSIQWQLEGDAAVVSRPWALDNWLRWDGQPLPLVSSQNLRPDRSSSDYGRGLAIEIDAAGKIAVMLGARLPAYALHVRTAQPLAADTWSHLHVQYDGSGKASGVSIYLDGALCSLEIVADGFNRRDRLAHPLPLRLGGEHAHESRWTRSLIAQPQWFTDTTLPDHWRDRIDSQRLSQLQAQWSGQETLPDAVRQTLLTLHLRSSDSPLGSESYRQAWQQHQQASEQRHALQHQMPTVMVMRDRVQPRETFLLHRGMYDAPRQVVQADVPAALQLAFPAGAPRNRLGLAAWLTAPEHPLTARVAVNRLWSQFFGTGLVRTAEDFGYQGEYPSHPELLDWLANDFIQSGWDVQHVQRQIVLSEAYRQESRLLPGSRQQDPDNRLLSRGPRSRLPAETLRDHLLSVGGLLKHRLGGPSVYPLQPDDLYQGIVVDAPYDGTKWGVSTGDDLYRRSLYTFWKRTVPYPVLNVFDAPDREFCVARRSPTNTPLQALVLLNEPTLLQAASGLADQMLAATAAADNSVEAGLQHGFRASTGRVPQDAELASLITTLETLTAGFAAAPDEAALLLQREPATGETDADAHAEPNAGTANIVKQAAWVAVASVLLNLDETITNN